MGPTAVAAVALILACGSARAAENSSDPTRFETFATSPNAVVTLDWEAGSLESTDAHAQMFVVIVQDAADPSKTMRGVRIDLRDGAETDRLYLDETEFAELRSELSMMGNAIWRWENAAELFPRAPTRALGTGMCWRRAHAIRILCPTYVIKPDWSGLTLAPYGGHAFEFSERRPSDLDPLIARATATLGNGESTK